MQATPDGPATSGTDNTGSDSAPEGLPGFSDAMVGFPVPGMDGGHPEGAAAVGTGDEGGAPAPVKTDKAPTPPAPGEDKPDAAQSVNFDGLSDKSRSFYEKALKAGVCTPEDVERARTETTFQSIFTKKTQALAKERESFEKEMAERKSDLEAIDKIRSSDKLYAKFLRVAREGDSDEEDPSASDIPDRKTAAQIADERITAREREKEAARAKQAQEYRGKQASLAAAIQESMKILGVDRATMKAYLDAEEPEIEGDPVLAIDPKDLIDRVTRRHERAKYEARIADLESKLGMKATKQVHQSKQSQPPTRRTAEPSVSEDAWEQAKAQAGADPDFGNVLGFGWGPRRQ